MEPSNIATESDWPFPDQSGLERTGGRSESRHALASTLKEYWQIAVRWRLLIAAIVLVTLAVGLVVTVMTPRLYTTGARIQISRGDSNVANVRGESDKNYFDDQFFDTQYALLKAPSLAQRLARNLKLADDTSFFEAHGVDPAALGLDDRANASKRRTREELAAGLLLGGLTIAPVTHSDLVEIKYTCRSPRWSALIANAWPQEFIGANMDRQFATTGDARVFLEDRLGKLRLKLDDSENALITFAASRNIVKIGGTRDAQGRSSEPETLVASNLVALNAALVQARTERIGAQSRARSGAESSVADGNQSATMATLRSRRADVAAEYAKLSTQFEPGYVTLDATERQLEVIDAAIAKESSQLAAGRRASYAEAARREIELAQQVNQFKSQFDQQQRDTIKYNMLQREVDTNRQIYDALLQRYKEIGVAGSVGSTNVVLIDQAKMPGSPSSPNLTRNLLLSLLIGFVLAGIGVVAIEQVDESVHNPSDAEQLLKLPVVGAVPFIDKITPQMLRDQRSDLAEAYFSVWATLALSTSQGFPRSLMVTSSQPGEGKSLTSLSLAIAAGRAGKRVLLVDGDLRKPTLHSLLGLPNERGFSNLLTGEEIVPGMILETEYRGVSFIPSGPKPPSASELLAAPRTTEVIKKLVSQYDVLIVDGPPVIGLADAPLLGAILVCCLFVTQANRVPIRTVRNSLQRLRAANISLVGVLLTHIDVLRDQYGYSNSYGYGDDAQASAD